MNEQIKKGYFGQYGGMSVDSKIQAELERIDVAYHELKADPEFIAELEQLNRDFIGRPTPLYLCKNLTKKLGGAKIYVKREELTHTGGHKINHCMGEILLAKHLGKKKVIAETGAGQHGLALATAAAMMGLECEIHMGQVDIDKQMPNVKKMEMLGTKVVAVTKGQAGLKEAVDSSFEAYLNEYETALYCIGSVVGPHPYPTIIRDFQSVIGREAKAQHHEFENKLPDVLIACVGGGSNAMGLFNDFLDDVSVRMIGVEPANAATLNFGVKRELHGFTTLCLVDEAGKPAQTSTIASGLGYPGIGPQHAYLKETGRVEYVTATDKEVLEAFYELSKTEGIIPALESAHALAHAMKIAPTMNPDQTIIVNLSGRGDKDLDFVFENADRILSQN